MSSNFSLTYNGLTLTPDNGYTIQQLAGTDGLDIRTSRDVLTNEDGEIIYNRLYGGRTISIRGTVIGSSASDYFAKKRSLVDAFDRFASGTMSITRWDTVVRTIKAKAITTPQIIERAGENTIADFLVEVLAEDPFFLEDSTTTEVLTPGTTAGIVLNFTVPAAFGEGDSSNKVTINNTGDVARYPKITFTGPVTNPRLDNTTTSAFLGFNTTLAGGNTIVCYWLPSGIFYELNGTLDTPNSGTNYYGFKTGNLFKLATGNNSLSYNGSTGSCIIEFTNAYQSL